jgi:alkanesulfonate monooxygenase SsuD/methylene tetrahydromethanopterin reductase-like flavin-dependent oxidoreductase (luciferase family)
MIATHVNDSWRQIVKLGTYLPTGGETMMGGANPRWDDVLAMARTAEAIGFDFVGVLDHLYENYWEGWSILAALAATTERIELVSYVTCTAYRNPALLAKIADTVDEISGGRLVLGLGAGDSDTEHHIFGFPRERPVSRFAEAVEIITTLLREGRIDFAGEFYAARECELRPRGPRPAGPPILIGSLGGKRMERLTLRYADIWVGSGLVTHNTLTGVVAVQERIETACREAGRDPASLGRMVDAIVELPIGAGRTAAWSQYPPITGGPEEIAAVFRGYAAAGVTHAIIWIEPNTVAGLEAFAPVIEVLRGSEIGTRESGEGTPASS